MDYIHVGKLVESIGITPALLIFLIIYMTRTLSSKLDGLQTAISSETKTREQFQQVMIKELTTQTIYLSQLLNRVGIEDTVNRGLKGFETETNN